jgi:hypothetical protein
MVCLHVHNYHISKFLVLPLLNLLHFPPLAFFQHLAVAQAKEFHDQRIATTFAFLDIALSKLSSIPELLPLSRSLLLTRLSLYEVVLLDLLFGRLVVSAVDKKEGAARRGSPLYSLVGHTVNLVYIQQMCGEMGS